jgi:hypothetical protein
MSEHKLFYLYIRLALNNHHEFTESLSIIPSNIDALIPSSMGSKWRHRHRK